MKKYEFTGKSMEFEGMTLRRIRRLSDGVVGGWIQSEDNLSHEGGCFVYDNAKVYHFAKVFDNARVYGNARVLCHAQVYGNARALDGAWISDYAQVYDNALISGVTNIYDNAKVFGRAQVYNYASVYGKAQISGAADISGTAEVCGNAEVSHYSQVFGAAQICGNTKVTKSPVFIENECEFNITTYNEFIQVGCILHTKKEWQDYIDRKKRKYLDRCTDVESHDRCVEVLKSIINGKIV
jgi:carbonic anhydrase/acetyltransferase-like protein (isoleucine patch superfamily)